MKAVLAAQHPDPDTERFRSNHADALRELQSGPLAVARVVRDVQLADGVATNVSHGLGRQPQVVILSPVRGPSTVGMVQEVRSSGQDRTKFVVLRADGYGATITLDVVVA